MASLECSLLSVCWPKADLLEVGQTGKVAPVAAPQIGGRCLVPKAGLSSRLFPGHILK